MSDYETFKNAPITEAVLEIIADPQEGLQIEDLLHFPGHVRDRYSRTAQKLEFKGGFKMGAEVSILPGEQKAVGYLLHSDEDKKVIQSRMNGFAFSKLKPYENWEAFRSEARDLWCSYLEITKPKTISRISLRYINRIEIPMPMKDFSEYLLTNPQIAPGLPQTLCGLFMRLEIQEPTLDATGVVVLAVDKAVVPDRLPLIFDIDVMRKGSFVDNLDGIWDDFENLRIFKNEIFFKSLTDRAKELIR
ncbi:MAG: TIGR04255 family protein [Thermodesulfobacteriota bacterium]